MTLLLALSGPDVCVVAADRRVTANGALINDEFLKSTVLFCDDARLVIAFTGLASLGPFNTHRWLEKTLQEITSTRHVIAEIIAELRVGADATFAALPVASREVAFVLGGFVHWSREPMNIVYVLSNMGSSDGRFALTTHPPGEILAEAIGCTTAFTKEDADSVKNLIVGGAPPSALVRKAVTIIQRCAKDRRSGGLVGEQCNTAVIRRNADTTVTSTYHSAHITNRAHGASVVFGLSAGQWYVQSQELIASTLVSGPAIRKNSPCWCGSGSRFKHCHLKTLGAIYAKTLMFSSPLPMRVEQVLPTALPSGQKFVVMSSFT